MGEGCFVGLGVKIKFPFNSIDAPYSLIAGDCLAPTRLTCPFSLILPNNVVKPGWVLQNNAYYVER